MPRSLVDHDTAPLSATQPRAPHSDESAALNATRRYAELLGMPLLCCEARSGKIVAQTDNEQLPVIPTDVIRQLPQARVPKVFQMPSGLMYFTLPVPPIQGALASAVGYVLLRPGVRPSDLVLAAARCGWSQVRFERWLAELPQLPRTMLEAILRNVTEGLPLLTAAPTAPESAPELDAIAAELDYTYEEISLLHTLTQNMQISRAPRELAELSLQRLASVVQAEAHVICLDDPADPPMFLHEGHAPFDQSGMTRLVARFEDYDWSRPLVKNFVPETLLGSDFPGLKNFVLTPISEGNRRFGWLCSCNLGGDQEFGTVQASLLASVASILGTHGRNLDLYRQHEELLLCFVRSLVSSLDAKDPYTRGHSVRVALIARRLGAEMKLPEEDLQDIYLSGLLHDIGKIGVDDQILRKPSALTPEEFEQVKKHPVIGYNIVAGLKNLRRIIPGVRHHHESWSGDGYPDGLAGEEIPLMARIMAVADSYDAMGSDRPYRKGMPQQLLENILRKGAGVQWDARVVTAYFNARDAIKQICDTYSPTDGFLLDQTPLDSCGGSMPAALTPESLRAALSAPSLTTPVAATNG